MPRLARKAIGELRDQLSQWQSPDAMLSTVGQIDCETYFNQAGLQFVRDAWIGAEFCRVRRIRELRLVAATENWPDFEFRYRRQLEKFEAVEADDPKRRRGLEYRNCTKKTDTKDAYLAYVDQLPSWVEIACMKKAKRRYSKGASLVIYLNPSDFGARRQPKIEDYFPSATWSAKDAFKSVWVLWKNRVYRVWRNGKRDRYVLTDVHRPREI